MASSQALPRFPRTWCAAALSLLLHGLLLLSFLGDRPLLPDRPIVPPISVELTIATDGGTKEPSLPLEQTAPVPRPPSTAPSSHPMPSAGTAPVHTKKPFRSRAQAPLKAAFPSTSPGPEAVAPPLGEMPSGGPAPVPDVIGDPGNAKDHHEDRADGVSGSVLEAYLGDLRLRIERALVYPAVARRLGLSGKVIVAFGIRADGTVEPDSLSIRGGVDDALLRAAVIQTIREIGAFPSPPGGAIRIVAPVLFVLRPG